MAGVTAHGGTFSFAGFVGSVVGVSVETPTAEIADMSGMGHSVGQMVLIPTGDWSGGGVTVDFLAAGDPQSLVRSAGQLTFSSPKFSVSRRAILESASVEAKAGDIVRGTLRFRVTDYFGS